MLNNTTQSNKVICVSLPNEIADRLDAVAQQDRRTRSNMVAKIVTEYLEVKS